MKWNKNRQNKLDGMVCHMQQKPKKENFNRIERTTNEHSRSATTKIKEKNSLKI